MAGAARDGLERVGHASRLGAARARQLESALGEEEAGALDGDAPSQYGLERGPVAPEPVERRDLLVLHDVAPHEALYESRVGLLAGVDARDVNRAVLEVGVLVAKASIGRPADGDDSRRPVLEVKHLLAEPQRDVPAARPRPRWPRRRGTRPTGRSEPAPARAAPPPGRGGRARVARDRAGTSLLLLGIVALLHGLALVGV